MKLKILIIDDDMALCRLLKNNLEQEGYYVYTCHDGVIGLNELQHADYQLVILDIMLPLKNGYEVLEKIREKSFIPVLMLTAKDSEGDKVSGLRMGADDYLTKPFSNSEFLARVSSLLRRYTLFNTTNISDEYITVGRLSIHKLRREVHKDGLLLELTAKEFDLFLFFAENPGKVFTKKQIYRGVWNDEYAFDDNNIMVHIRRLRKKIEDNPESPKYILTVWGVGYKLDNMK
ncbi:DNA-binding response regulator [bacterium 1XD42-8]|jgi:DNA-binding response OmpR family regulator|nr:response regulator transcription factor [Lachnospiraceae bacterium]RKJ31560.1 DNA-binding response regulator [bacterium 1XD42-8]